MPALADDDVGVHGDARRDNPTFLAWLNRWIEGMRLAGLPEG